MFKSVDTEWKMYPIGLLFGLGFDTASEVTLLALAAMGSVCFFLLFAFCFLLFAVCCVLCLLSPVFWYLLSAVCCMLYTV
jgi:high-affinity nickel-transport protein